MDKKIIDRILNAQHSTRIKVRSNDIDATGVVHFNNYLIYFDDGFIDFMRAIENPVEGAVKWGIVFPVKKVSISYENSAVFGDDIVIETRIKEIGDKSVTFLHEIFRESDKIILAKAECVRAVMNLESKKLINVKEFFTSFV